MVWNRLNECVKFLEKPILGSENHKSMKKYMALCIDPKSNGPYKGIARQVISRKGNPDVPGFLDKSKLILVESKDLFNWRIKGDLQIEGFEEVIDKLKGKGKEFIGLEDPDILIDKKGRKHVYFTIPFKYDKKSLNDVDRYDVYVGHAEGDDLDRLIMTEPVLGKVDKKIVGFKEICPSSIVDEKGFILAETFVDKGKKRKYSAIGISKIKNLSGKWDYLKLVHDPEKESKNWCNGHSSPCRIFDPKILGHGKYFVGIMNGREKTKKINGKKHYGKFRPGLFLFDNKLGKIVWVDEEPLFEDLKATTITFASELVCLNKKEAILYAHPNDSFVRAYMLNIQKIKDRLPNKFS